MPKMNANVLLFHLAYKNGRLGIIELLIQKSAEFNIEVNDKVETGRIAFHLAYKNGHLEIVYLRCQK